MAQPSRSTFAGLFLVTLAAVTYEVLLTRIFSVIMWYHFAFVAISVAMFGMSFGAVLVYVLPRIFTVERTKDQLTYSALGFGYGILLYCVLKLGFTDDARVLAAPSLLSTYVFTAVPFVFNGVCVCLALTRYPRQTSRLYFADLVGAACGCLAMIGLLRFFTGPAALLVIACIASLAGLLFSRSASTAARARSVIAVVVITGATVASLAAHGTRFAFAELRRAQASWIYEKWNPFSRIMITPDPSSTAPFGWGLSHTFRLVRPAQKSYSLVIDSVAATPITNYAGDDSNLQFLRSDIINTANHLRQNARVLVIGAGGGRDVLSALVFHQQSVEAVEINGDSLDALNGRYGDFSGHLDRDPRVKFVNDEARSYIARQHSRYDIIQASLVDTFAASAAGAFVLTENSLYTVEAWKTFLDKLNPHGILTFSRWYPDGTPWEYRLTALATQALAESGMANPRAHIVILRVMGVRQGNRGVGTMLVSKDPFTAADIAGVETLAREMQFEVVLTPNFALDDTFARIATSRNVPLLASTFAVDISPPTDDRPFFFDMLRWRDFLQPVSKPDSVYIQANSDVVATLLKLAIFVLVLTIASIVVPLAFTVQRSALRASVPFFFYFGGIGVGFMMVEISQMQRLIVFLGHPTYALSVVLFSLLTFSGLGSLSTGGTQTRRRSHLTLLLLLACLAVFGGVTPMIIARFAGAATPLRIFLAVLILAPIGFLMGTAFPLGIAAAADRAASITPWLWGINGAASVLASVLAVIVAMAAGITASFWIGVSAYLVAVIAFFAAQGQGVTSTPDLRVASAGR